MVSDAYDFMGLKKIFHTWQTSMAEGSGWNMMFWCNHDQPRGEYRGSGTKRDTGSSQPDAGDGHPRHGGTPYIYQGENWA